MKNSLLAAGLGILIATSALSSAQADERWPRWYLGLSGGYTYMTDQDISGSAAGIDKMSLNNGYGFGGSIGYLPSSSAPLLNAMRFEAEVTYHHAGIDKLKGNGINITGSGSYSSTAYMANAFYDFPTSSQWSPYIGVGVGMATVYLPTSSGLGNTEGSDNEFAYQALVGLGYSPVTIPNTQWTIGYRYLATSKISLDGVGSSNIKADYSTNSLEAGVHLRF